MAGHEQWMSQLSQLASTLTDVVGELHPAAKVVVLIYQQYTKVKYNRSQCKSVCKRSHFIVVSIDAHLKSNHVSGPVVSNKLGWLEETLNGVHRLMNELSSLGFFRSFLRQKEIAEKINNANQSLSDILLAFCASTTLMSVDQQFKSELARQGDAEDLDQKIMALGTNDKNILTQLEITREHIDEAMLAMHKEIYRRAGTSTTTEPQALQRILDILEKNHPRKRHLETPLEFTIT